MIRFNNFMYSIFQTCLFPNPKIRASVLLPKRVSNSNYLFRRAILGYRFRRGAVVVAKHFRYCLAVKTLTQLESIEIC